MMRLPLVLILLLLVVLFTSCREKRVPDFDEATKGSRWNFPVLSTAFGDSENIPEKYTADGQDISPPLAFGPFHESTKSVALIVDDPDAPRGTFTHWVLFNLPPDTNSLPENVPATEKLENGAVQGLNSAGKVGYLGPDPPSGVHHYIFHVYSLDTMLDLDSSATKEQVEAAMQDHIIGRGTLTGLYTREK